MMPRPFPIVRLAAVAALALLLAACSPVFNWREVPVGDAGLTALLPCKPDRAARTLELDQGSVAVNVAGCQTGNATFAVAQVMAGSRSQADAWLAGWRGQMRQRWRGRALDESPAALPRADAAPPVHRLRTTDAGPAIDVLWFSQTQAGGRVALYQATVLGVPDDAAATTTFFEGLHLP